MKNSSEDSVPLATLYRAKKVSGRWVVETKAPDASPSSGTSLTFTRKGVEITGWYDHICATGNGWGLSWAALDAIREALRLTTPTESPAKRLAEIRARWINQPVPHRAAWPTMIDYARTDVPWLLGEVERLRGLIVTQGQTMREYVQRDYPEPLLPEELTAYLEQAETVYCSSVDAFWLANPPQSDEPPEFYEARRADCHRAGLVGIIKALLRRD